MTKGVKGPRKGRFKPGNQAGKGHGRPQVMPEVKAIRQVNKAKVESLINHFMSIPLAEVIAIAASSETLGLEAMIATVVIKAIESGDHARLNYLIERLIGKVPDAPKDIRIHLSSMPQAQVVTLGREAIAFLEGVIDDSESQDG